MSGVLTLAVELAWWQQTGIRAVLGLVAVLLPAGMLVYLFLFKMMSFMQSRLGPMEAGPYGSLQLLAEVGKFLQKEDIIPEKADRIVFKAAPFVVLISTFLLVIVIPAGPDVWFIDVDTGIFLALAVSSISVIGILMAGWASSSKYSLLGALRAAGQLVAYELPLLLAVVGVVIQAGTLNVQGIVMAQATGEIFGWGGIGNPFILTQFLGFAIFLIAVQAELTQPPFDMPVAESELVTGYLTEYSGMRFLLFFISEFATAGDNEENECGSDSLDAESMPVDVDEDGICDSMDDYIQTPDPVDDEETPGFGTLAGVISMLGAAMFLGRRRE